MKSSRAEYEAAVADLRQVAMDLRNRGYGVDAVARMVVLRRNHLKERYRVGLPLPVLLAIEARNRALYGDPIGPTAKSLFTKYGDWDAVIEAACRPARLSDG